jgi:hypothetical protein
VSTAASETGVAAELGQRLHLALLWLLSLGLVTWLSLWLAGVFVHLILLLIFVALAIWLIAAAMVAGFRLRHAGAAAILVALPALAALGLALPTVRLAARMGYAMPSYLLLYRHRAELDAIASGRELPVPGGYRVAREEGRTAFVTENGMLGSWGGLVHDPTGALTDIDRWQAEIGSEGPPRMFDSIIVWCDPLGGRYYHCAFD